MSPEDVTLVFSLNQLSNEDLREEMLAHFGADSGTDLAVRLLGEAIAERNGLTVAAALHVCFTFWLGVNDPQPIMPMLVHLVRAPWHQSHEQVLNVLTDADSPDLIETFVWAANWLPTYAYTTAPWGITRKALTALQGIDSPAARAALVSFATYSDPDVVKFARQSLRYWDESFGSGGRKAEAHS